MKDISGKIQGIANGFSFLIILGGVLTIINGISQYSDYWENYGNNAWLADEYDFLADIAINTITLGVAVILSGILFLFVLHGFAQLIENSNKLVKIADQNSQLSNRRF